MTKSRTVVALELSPIGERFHTGISNVTKALASQILGDTEAEPYFFISRQKIPTALVEHVLKTDGTEPLWWFATRMAEKAQGPDLLDARSIAIYTGNKRHPRLFETEVQIVHDLTALITPQYHTSETVSWWQRRILPDLLSSDLIVAISESTRLDIRTYLPQVADIPVIAVPLAACVDTDRVIQYDSDRIEPYVLVLGTLEPRKNVEFVFRCIAENRALLDLFDFVFVGRWGWGSRTEELMFRLALTDEVTSGRIRFTGFVTDAVRDQLLAAARCVVYPSRYEGFGLPILEALKFGVPVVTGVSSSLPEVGGTHVSYCDVDAPDTLAALLHGHSVVANPDTKRQRVSWADGFDWRSTYSSIKAAALALPRGQGELS